MTFNSKTRVFLLFSLLVLGSCEKFLDPYPNDDRSEEDIWNYQESVQGLIGRAYDNISRNYNTNEGVYLDGATDDGVLTSSTHAIKRLATGTITPGQDAFLTYWDRSYQSIFLVNLFLKDDRGYNTRFLIDEEKNNVLRRRLKGEAFALRAWFQWDLLKKFGGKAVNGELLGFPIVTEPLDIAEEIDYARNTYDECVRQIIADCDSANKYLLIANRDFLVDDPSDLLYLGGRNWGRMDGITMIALKSNVYLTWASPRFNPDNDISRWDSAAVNAKKVIDFKLNVDGGVANGFNPENGVDWSNPNFPGIIMSSRYVNADEAIERMFYPGGFQGNGVIGATQELVEAFPMANGYPIDDPMNRGNYDPENPYQDRDPRFYSTIFHNKAEAKRNNTGETMYTFENWKNGGKDAAELKADNSLTNYYIKKFIFMGYNRTDATVNRQPRSVYYIRWAHMLLNFAEAANQVVGPNDEATYGISATTAIRYLRSRKTSDGQPGLSSFDSTDPYLAEVAASGADAFTELVKNERRLETCFEGMRFFDLRRWSSSLEDLNTTAHGIDIENEGDGVFSYTKKPLEVRSFSSAFLPIPYSEILRMDNLVQNEGWDGWD